MLKNKIDKLLIFTSDGKGPLKLSQRLDTTEIQIIAVTFPYKTTFLVEGSDGKPKEVTLLHEFTCGPKKVFQGLSI